MSQSATLDINEDLSVEGLADCVRQGILVRVQIPAFGDRKAIRGIVKGFRRDDDVGHFWIDCGDEGPTRLNREDFVVLGPVDTKDVQAICHRHSLGRVKQEAELSLFVACMIDLVQVGMGDFMSNEPTFKVRLDVDAKALDKDRYDGSVPGPLYPRGYRILVRPVQSPVLHDEIKVVTEIAEKHGLSTQIGQAGIEIREPGDVG